MTVIYILVVLLTTPGFLYLLRLITQLVIVHKICTHPSLTDEKVKYITGMFSAKNRKF